VCQNNFPEARRLFNLALRDAPRNRFVFLAWGEMEASQGNSGKARYLLRRGHKWNPSDPALLQAWGRLEASAGKLDKARYLFNKGVQVRTNTPRRALRRVLHFHRPRKLGRVCAHSETLNSDRASQYHDVCELGFNSSPAWRGRCYPVPSSQSFLLVSIRHLLPL
jgi:tetratricopeptide (TPR) repeat protein